MTVPIVWKPDVQTVRRNQPRVQADEVPLISWVRTAAGKTAEICPSSDGTDGP